MFYVVPKDHSIVKSEKHFEWVLDAATYAMQRKRETGQDYDIIMMERKWTTQTLGEMFGSKLKPASGEEETPA